MPHLGTQPPVGFKTTTKQSFSGDNSTTAFTLNRASSTATDLEVFVDNIQQEPTTAYSVSGTTLTFTEAPPTGTNNVYVVNRGGDQNGTLPPQDLGTTDYIFGDDISFNSDSAKLNFGADSEITITHVADTGLNFKHTATGDDKPIVLTLQTGETDIAANDVLGTINFQAPDEGTGTDAILVAAGIEAVSEGDFSSSSNATKLVFKTGASEAATSKMTLSSGGVLNVDGGITVDNITIDGTEIDLSSGDLTLDSAGEISLDSGTGVIRVKDGGTQFGSFIESSNNFIIKSQVSDGDLVLMGNDGGSEITAMTIDMSAGGNVGIGTTAPTQKLTVNAGSTDAAVAVFTGNDTNRGLKISTDTANSQTDMLVVLEAQGQHSGSYEGEISFKTANTERVRIDKSGVLTVDGGIKVDNITIDGSEIDFSTSGDFTVDAAGDIVLDAAGANILLASAGSNFGSLNSISNNFKIKSEQSDQDIIFAVNDGGSEVEAMRIDGSGGGDVGIGTNSPGGLRLFVTKSQSTGSNVVQFSNSNSSGNVFCVGTSIESNGNNTSSFHVRSVTQQIGTFGLLGNGTQSFTSDRRLKKNIETTRDGYLEDLAKLRVVKYNWHNHDDGTPKELGLIAQEVQEVFPNLVRTDDEELNGITDPKSLKMSVIPFMVLKALQEATARIQTLESKVKTLEGG